MGHPHLLVIPFPAQGHVMPLMELSHSLVDRGFKITFVNTESTHKLVVDAMSKNGYSGDFIHLVSLPDVAEIGEDRNDLIKLGHTMINVMPEHLEKLIKEINGSENSDNRITCVIADLNLGWALKVAEKMSIPRAALWPASATLLASIFHIPKLIEEGIITAADGTPTKSQMIQLSPTMPAMNTAHLVWLCMGGGDLAIQKSVFKMLGDSSSNMELADADYNLCNSFYELEPSVFELYPNLKPIGPLSGSSRLAHFWPEDSTCLSWLDQQPAQSVIYVAFGSLAVLDKRQLEELAFGLELSGQPYLWVVRPGLTEEIDVFKARVGSRGQLVGWAPQREVLAHPSVACFLTHCGWNSTMEGLSAGVPLLCCPCFADQILNGSYICDVWKTGLGLVPDENGLISRDEINGKVVRLLTDEEIRASSLKYKELAIHNVSSSGASSSNFDDFVQNWLCNLPK